MSGEKSIATTDALKDVVARLRREGKRIAFSNGCFEILHVGHLRSLQDARSHGDCLIVAINSDDSVRQYKGREEPIVPEHERAEILGGLACVDFVTSFGELNLERTLRMLRPDVHAKGTDYTAANVPEAAVDHELAIEIAICGDPKQRSSTELAQRAE
jgi:rfaE bifunctional protein nucleotidyltransferase chain/domain